MSSSQNGIALHITVHVAPENVPKFFEYFKPVFDKVVAEPELKFFQVYQSEEDPGTLSWVEHWAATKEWLFATQSVKEYYKEYLTATEAMFVKPREAKIVNLLGPEYSVSKK